MRKDTFQDRFWAAFDNVKTFFGFVVFIILLFVAFLMCGFNIAKAADIDASDPVPGINKVCWSVTNYWPFDEDGQIVSYAGQADGDPYHTAGMIDVAINRDFDWVAGPLSLLEAGAAIKLSWLDEPLPVWDTFGDEAYQAGVFWHDGYGRYVIGIDVFTAVPIHYLECNGEVIYP